MGSVMTSIMNDIAFVSTSIPLPWSTQLFDASGICLLDNKQQKLRESITTALLHKSTSFESIPIPVTPPSPEPSSLQLGLQISKLTTRYNIPIPSPSTTPLSQLRATLSAQTSIPITQLKLVHKGAVLKDYTLTLSSYGITDGSQLVMIGKEGDIPSAPPAPRPQVVKKKNKQPETDTESVLVDWIRSLVNSTLDPLQASIATFLSYTRVAKEGEQLNQPRQIPKFDILQKEHARLSELLLRGLLDLDGVEIPGEWQDARKERKEGVRRVQGELTKVDDAWTEKKKAEKAE